MSASLRGVHCWSVQRCTFQIVKKVTTRHEELVITQE
jgi:hypothetical protein